mmetsp:Transcript_64469/g.153899  ORF Transcript_64469/g.153899 Transcript_64469/m.153899 type:complete len:273 (+) Transcript_64469:1439-2257(+)
MNEARLDLCFGHIRSTGLVTEQTSTVLPAIGLHHSPFLTDHDIAATVSACSDTLSDWLGASPTHTDLEHLLDEEAVGVVDPNPRVDVSPSDFEKVLVNKLFPQITSFSLQLHLSLPQLCGGISEHLANVFPEVPRHGNTHHINIGGFLDELGNVILNVWAILHWQFAKLQCEVHHSGRLVVDFFMSLPLRPCEEQRANESHQIHSSDESCLHESQLVSRLSAPSHSLANLHRIFDCGCAQEQQVGTCGEGHPHPRDNHKNYPDQDTELVIEE